MLADAYRGLRAAYHRKALSEQPGLLLHDELADEREKVRTLWRDLMEEKH